MVEVGNVLTHTQILELNPKQFTIIQAHPHGPYNGSILWYDLHRHGGPSWRTLLDNLFDIDPEVETIFKVRYVMPEPMVTEPDADGWPVPIGSGLSRIAERQPVGRTNFFSKREFEEDLRVVINKHSIENESNTPDYILAALLSNVLTDWADATKARDRHAGRIR